MVQVHAQLPDDHHAALAANAAAHDRSLSAELRRAVREYVARLGEKPNEKDIARGAELAAEHGWT